MESNIPPKSVKNTSLHDDWKIIKSLNWTGVALGAAPPYNLQAQKFDNLNVYQYYSILIIAITAFGFAYSFVGRIFYVYPFMNLTVITMDALSSIVWTVLNVTIAGFTAFSTASIDQMFNSLIKNDMFLHKQQKRKSEYKYPVKFRILITVLHVTFIATVVYDSYTWLNIFGSPSLGYYFFKNFQYFVLIFISLRLCEILRFIEKRFSSSTNILINLVDEMHKLPQEDGENVEDELKANKWVRVSQKIKPRQEDIMQLKLLSKIFDTLFDSVQLFNEIFKKQLLFLMIGTTIEILQSINFLIAYGSKSLADPRISNVFFVISRIAWTALFLVS